MTVGIPFRAAAAVLVAAAAFSSPLTAQWPAGQGKYWTKLSVFYHSTTEQYRASGEKRPFLASNAQSRSSALFFDALVGVTNRLDLWLQVPYFDLNFDDDAEKRHSSGVGDVRLSARHNLFGFRDGSVQVSGRFTVKVPIVDFPIDAEVIPVGEGQWDYEAWLEAGASFWPIPAYGVLWLGCRWRAMNSETTRDPGDEFPLLAELGGTFLGPLGGKIVLDAIFGSNGSIQGVNVSNDEREIVYLQPTVNYQITSAFLLEAAVRVPLRGQNFPAGPQFMVAVFHRPVGEDWPKLGGSKLGQGSGREAGSRRPAPLAVPALAPIVCPVAGASRAWRPP